MLPLIKATLATVVLYFVIGNWNSWFNAMIYLRTRSKFPLQLVLREILITASDAATTGTVTSSTETGDTALYRQLTPVLHDHRFDRADLHLLSLHPEVL